MATLRIIISYITIKIANNIDPQIPRYRAQPAASKREIPRK